MASRSARDGAVSLARLCDSLQRAADDERQRTSRVLHDAAGQTLAAAAMSLSLVELEAAALSPDGRRALGEAQELAATCARELRELSAALFPPLLLEAGLAPALRVLAARHEQRVRFELGELPRFAPARELGAYRLIEEALASLFLPAPVLGSARSEGRGALVLTLEGRPRRASGLVRLSLRQRVRAAGAHLRLRALRGRLALLVRFPAR
jgi:glucose-6-phosphate-specific signal transduction histidine kinase